MPKIFNSLTKYDYQYQIAQYEKRLINGLMLQAGTLGLPACKCECGSEATYRDATAAMHSSWCPAHNEG